MLSISDKLKNNHFPFPNWKCINSPRWCVVPSRWRWNQWLNFTATVHHLLKIKFSSLRWEQPLTRFCFLQSKTDGWESKLEPSKTGITTHTGLCEQPLNVKSSSMVFCFIEWNEQLKIFLVTIILKQTQQNWICDTFAKDTTFCSYFIGSSRVGLGLKRSKS